MTTIYKYEIKPDGKVTLPNGCKILKAASQGDGIFLWAEVDTERSTLPRHFEVFGTGWEMSQDMGIDRVYIDTVFMGTLVFHVYERL